MDKEEVVHTYNGILLSHQKKCMRAGGEGDDQGWDGWMASRTRRTWVWVNSGRWRWTGRPGVLRFMGTQRVGHDWATELNWTKTWMKLEPVNQSELRKRKRISYINTYVWNLGKWYWWTVQGRKRDTDINNRLLNKFLPWFWLEIFYWTDLSLVLYVIVESVSLYLWKDITVKNDILILF